MHILAMFVLLSSQLFSHVSAACTSNEKAFSLWLILDCNQPFEIGSITIEEVDTFSNDKIVDMRWNYPISAPKGFFLQRFSFVMKNDEIVSTAFEFDIRTNTTCNAEKEFRADYVDIQTVSCNMESYGPHVILNRRSLDNLAPGFITEEAY